MKALCHLADAGIGLALIVALGFGIDLRVVVVLILALEVVSALSKALNAFLEPLVSVMRARLQ